MTSGAGSPGPGAPAGSRGLSFYSVSGHRGQGLWFSLRPGPRPPPSGLEVLSCQSHVAGGLRLNTHSLTWTLSPVTKMEATPVLGDAHILGSPSPILTASTRPPGATRCQLPSEVGPLARVPSTAWSLDMRDKPGDLVIPQTGHVCPQGLGTLPRGQLFKAGFFSAPSLHLKYPNAIPSPCPADVWLGC